MANVSLHVSRIVVKADRLVCDIVLSPYCPRNSSPALMNILQKQHPALPKHVCKNKHGVLFGEVMNGTSLIHVLEHVAIDCMVQEMLKQKICSDKLIMGNSQWLDRNAGTGRLELGFQDDIAALHALNCAAAQINDALEQVFRVH